MRLKKVGQRNGRPPQKHADINANVSLASFQSNSNRNYNNQVTNRIFQVTTTRNTNKAKTLIQNVTITPPSPSIVKPHDRNDSSPSSKQTPAANVESK